MGNQLSLLSELVNKAIFALVVFMLASALDTNTVKVVLSCFLGLIMLKKLNRDAWVLVLSKEAIALFLLIALCLVNSVYYYFFSGFNVEIDSASQLLSIRKFFIESVYAFFLYFFIRDLSLDRVFQVIYFGAIINCVIVLPEIGLALTSTYRASMLFFEPSSAGFYYCFCVFLLYLGAGDSKFRKITFYLFTVLGLFAFSKAQFIVITIVVFLTLKRKIKLLSVILAVLIALIFGQQISDFNENLMDTNMAVNGVNIVFNSISERGVYGLSTEYDVYETYVTRLSAIYVSFIALIEYPFGIGISTFNVWYKHYLIESNLVNIFMAKEVDMMFFGEAYASPKSRVLELVVGAGIFGAVCLVYIFKSFLDVSKKVPLLYLAFLSTFLAGCILELNPLLDYFVFLIVLLEKYRSGLNIE